MKNAMYVAVDGIGIVLVFLMLINFGTRDAKKNDTADKLFDTLLIVNMSLLVSDLLLWIINGAEFRFSHFLNNTFTCIYYIMHPVICFTWLIYCEYKIYSDAEKIKKKLPVYFLPIIITVILTFISCRKPFLFWIDDNNFYHRGKCFILFFCLSFIYIAHTIIIIHYALIRNRRSEFRRKCKVLLIYPLFPFIGGIIQTLLPDVAILWVCSAIALLILFFHLQNTKITKDALTGVNNRRCFESFIEFKLDNRKLQYLFLFMIDIDKFKLINDRYGHLTGDDALKNTSSLLIRSVCRSDFIARIGGDEFVIIGERETKTDILETINEINSQFRIFNDEGTTKYKLSLSIGCCIITKDDCLSADELISAADSRMYDEKQKHHKDSASR
ncbi:MAG: GGDEF domain-containing protein [Oscillospiraceae bacterium]|nr:GGDEF domain-containing protein [Oscillospiraceae bacterium]